MIGVFHVKQILKSECEDLEFYVYIDFLCEPDLLKDTDFQISCALSGR